VTSQRAASYWLKLELSISRRHSEDARCIDDEQASTGALAIAAIQFNRRDIDFIVGQALCTGAIGVRAAAVVDVGTRERRTSRHPTPPSHQKTLQTPNTESQQKISPHAAGEQADTTSNLGNPTIHLRPKPPTEFRAVQRFTTPPTSSRYRFANSAH